MITEFKCEIMNLNKNNMSCGLHNSKKFNFHLINLFNMFNNFRS